LHARNTPAINEYMNSTAGPAANLRERRAALIFALALVAGILATACGGANQLQGKRYHLEGTVISIDKPQQRVVVDHKEIPGFMGAMAMPYPVADPKDLDRLAPGDQITADVVVGDNRVRLANIVVVKKSDGKAPVTSGDLAPRAEVVPDFTLVNQDAKRIRLEQFRGKSVLLTFIYTRCPLPDYCPLMTHNFAQIEKSLAKSPVLYGKTHLLSISFDSQYDTPAVLRNYAKAFVTDRGAHTFDHWEFATIPAAENNAVTKFFDVFVSQDQGQITHSMSTAIISPDGHVYKTYTGNDWKPDDVLADLTASAGEGSNKISQIFRH
jgi:protein SCO1/2